MEYYGVSLRHYRLSGCLLIPYRMMNNCWYTVRIDIDNNDKGSSVLYFRHPCEPGSGTGGWMQPSWENRIENIKHEAASPQKQFTREEIEKHNKDNDCWIVINGKVYDATSVLDWHPGGKYHGASHVDACHSGAAGQVSDGNNE